MASTSDQFRKILQMFYIKANSSLYADVYKKMLNDQFDEVQAEPIHILTLTEKPSFKNINPMKKQHRKLQCLYKSTDFPAVFLFSFLLNALKRNDNVQFLADLKKRVQDNLSIFYRQSQSQDSIKYKFIFKGIFKFCQSIVQRKYDNNQIDTIFKAFYWNSIQKRGLGKNQREKYLTEPQLLLSFFLGRNGIFPSKKQVSQPNSDIYDMNSLQFCINIQNMDQKQEWTIGEGQNHINIAKQKNQYLVYEQFIQKQQDEEEQMDQIWTNILIQSEAFNKQQIDRTLNIFTSLDIIDCSSPAKSMKSPKSVQIKTLNKKVKIGDFL